MRNSSEDVIRVLRNQAWERAKGELRSVSQSFFGEASAREGQFEDFDELSKKFIAQVENEGLAE